MARFFVYSTEEAVAALKEAHIPYRVHGECCISVNNNDYSAAVKAFFRNDVSFQPEQEVFPITKFLAFGLAAACAALAQEAIPYSLDCQRHILVDENHYFEAIDVFDDYDIDFDVIRNF